MCAACVRVCVRVRVRVRVHLRVRVAVRVRVLVRVRVHLPLLVPEPEKCGMRVAGETRHWKVGEALAFDDAFEHEVWNDGVEERVVLLLDLWHPDLTPEEIDGVRGMFREIERMQEARREKG